MNKILPLLVLGLLFAGCTETKDSSQSGIYASISDKVASLSPDSGENLFRGVWTYSCGVEQGCASREGVYLEWNVENKTASSDYDRQPDVRMVNGQRFELFQFGSDTNRDTLGQTICKGKRVWYRVSGTPSALVDAKNQEIMSAIAEICAG